LFSKWKGRYDPARNSGFEGRRALQHTTLIYTVSSNGLTRYAFIEEPVCN
jgi:hypothetical protein